MRLIYGNSQAGGKGGGIAVRSSIGIALSGMAAPGFGVTIYELI